ncbi:Cytosolic copper metallochaperone [Entophlyctis luteolus]|nr:Cytosolic copper metallochaperone [Entophlyctis luteolus]
MLAVLASKLFPMENTYQFQVLMTCTGCSGAVDRVLKKTAGVTSYDISLETKTVTVVSTLSQDEVMNVIKATGKPVSVL